MSQFSSSQDIFDNAKSWQWRATRASLGTTTGAILLAILGYLPAGGPAFGKCCDIMLDGTVTTAARNRDGEILPDVTIGTIDAIRDNFRRLADHCRFNDADRTALFDELRKWVRKDFRALTDPDQAVTTH